MTDISAELLAALINDKAKSQRLAELLEQEKKNQDILAAAQAERDAASRALGDAHRVREETAQHADELQRRRDEVTAQEEQLGAMLTSLNAEKDAFNQIRKQVEDDLADRTAVAVAKGNELSDRELHLDNRDVMSETRERLAKTAHEKALKLHEAVVAAIAEHQSIA